MIEMAERAAEVDQMKGDMPTYIRIHTYIRTVHNVIVSLFVISSYLRNTCIHTYK